MARDGFEEPDDIRPTPEARIRDIVASQPPVLRQDVDLLDSFDGAVQWYDAYQAWKEIHPAQHQALEEAWAQIATEQGEFEFIAGGVTYSAREWQRDAEGGVEPAIHNPNLRVATQAADWWPEADLERLSAAAEESTAASSAPTARSAHPGEHAVAAALTDLEDRIPGVTVFRAPPLGDGEDFVLRHPALAGDVTITLRPGPEDHLVLAASFAGVVRESPPLTLITEEKLGEHLAATVRDFADRTDNVGSLIPNDSAHQGYVASQAGGDAGDRAHTAMVTAHAGQVADRLALHSGLDAQLVNHHVNRPGWTIRIQALVVGEHADGTVDRLTLTKPAFENLKDRLANSDADGRTRMDNDLRVLVTRGPRDSDPRDGQVLASVRVPRDGTTAAAIAGIVDEHRDKLGAAPAPAVREAVTAVDSYTWKPSQSISTWTATQAIQNHATTVADTLRTRHGLNASVEAPGHPSDYGTASQPQRWAVVVGEHADGTLDRLTVTSVDRSLRERLTRSGSDAVTLALTRGPRGSDPAEGQVLAHTTVPRADATPHLLASFTAANASRLNQPPALTPVTAARRPLAVTESAHSAEPAHGASATAAHVATVAYAEPLNRTALSAVQQAQQTSAVPLSAARATPAPSQAAVPAHHRHGRS